MENIKKRQPITGLRQPITGLRVPIKLADIADPEMRWEIQYEKLNNYIKYVAGQVAPGIQSGSITAEDLYQEGLLKLYNQFNEYILKPETEFHYIFKASLWRHLKGMCYKKKEHQVVDLDEVFDNGEDAVGFTDDVFEEIYEENRISQVRELLSRCPVAESIFQELIEPSESTVLEAQKEFNDKIAKVASGKRKFVASEVEVKPDTVRKVLKIPKGEFNEYMRMIRSVVYSIYSQDTRINSYCKPVNDTYIEQLKNVSSM